MIHEEVKLLPGHATQITWTQMSAWFFVVAALNYKEVKPRLGYTPTGPSGSSPVL